MAEGAGAGAGAGSGSGGAAKEERPDVTFSLVGVFLRTDIRLGATSAGLLAMAAASFASYGSTKAWIGLGFGFGFGFGLTLATLTP